MEATPFPMVTEVRAPQELKEDSPIEVTLPGIVMDFRLKQVWYLQLVVFQFVVLKTVEKWLCRFC